jgi:hypothetical protein
MLMVRGQADSGEARQTELGEVDHGRQKPW